MGNVQLSARSKSKWVLPVDSFSFSRLLCCTVMLIWLILGDGSADVYPKKEFMKWEMYGNVWKCAKGIGICIIDGFFQVKWKVWHQWTGTDKLGGMMHHGPTSCMQVLRCSPPSASWASCKLSHMIMQFMEVSSEIHLCKPSSPKSSITTTPTVVSSKNLMAS